MVTMDSRNTAEIFKQLEKQNELIEVAHRKLSHELHKVQVEEEMLMRKFFEITAALGLHRKGNASGRASSDTE